MVPVHITADATCAPALMGPAFDPAAFQRRRCRTGECLPTSALEKTRSLLGRTGVLVEIDNAPRPVELDPRIYYRLTDNWLELTVRFVVGTYRIRDAKDAMSRHVITELDRAGIGIASATYDIVGFTAIEVRQASTAKAVQPLGNEVTSTSRSAGAPQPAD